MNSIERRARIHLRSKYREYLWHSSVAHATRYESIRNSRRAQAMQARYEAWATYWIITGKNPWPAA